MISKENNMVFFFTLTYFGYSLIWIPSGWKETEFISIAFSSQEYFQRNQNIYFHNIVEGIREKKGENTEIFLGTIKEEHFP